MPLVCSPDHIRILLLRIVRSSVDGRPIYITCDTDQHVICSRVNGALSSAEVHESEMYLEMLCL